MKNIVYIFIILTGGADLEPSSSAGAEVSLGRLLPGPACVVVTVLLLFAWLLATTC